MTKKKEIIKKLRRKPKIYLAFLVTGSVLLFAAPLILLGFPDFGVSLALGIMAAALSQHDEHPHSHIKSGLLMMFCFIVVTFATAFFKSNPSSYVLFFAFSSFIITLIGGYSPRMSLISYGTILIGLYAAIGFNPADQWWIVPLALCIGALIFHLVQHLVLLYDPYRPLKNQMAIGYQALSNYLSIKADLLLSDDLAATKNKLAESNIAMTQALERCKVTLTSYGKDVSEEELKPYLNFFIVLQNLHERAASTHGNYTEWAKEKEYVEILEGLAELLRQLSNATHLVSVSLFTGQMYTHPLAIRWILNSLEKRVRDLSGGRRDILTLFLYNLYRSHRSLERLKDKHYPQNAPQLEINQRSVRTYFSELMRGHNARLRYAFRLSLSFLIGTSFVYSLGISSADWVPLTIFFVSQTTYRDTRKRMGERIVGTLTGMIIGAVAIYLLPTILGQMLWFILCLYFFFFYVKDNYTYAVIFISAFVLSASELMNQSGYDFIQPRVFCTIIGAMIAYLMTRLLWPDWQYKRLPVLIHEALQVNVYYFKCIITRSDDLVYRIARRQAHLADNRLAQARQSIQVEPKKHRDQLQYAIHLIYINHAFLSHLSALGVHRGEDWSDNSLIKKVELIIFQALHDANEGRSGKDLPLLNQLKQELRENIEKASNSRIQSIYRLYDNILNSVTDFLELLM